MNARSTLLSTLFVTTLAGCGGVDTVNTSPTRDPAPGDPAPRAYPIVDTQQSLCYGTDGSSSACEAELELRGQDGHYAGTPASYEVPGDGTVADLVTGLVWQAAPLISTFDEAPADCAAADTGGYTDWRVPTIRELYSLMDFRGQTGSGAVAAEVPDDAVPYLDATVFDFAYGTEADLGVDRYIDAQYLSSTAYVHTVMNGMPAFFGVNFADGRIKGYPQNAPMSRGWFLRCVRGATYGDNDFVDLGDGTVEDRATGLTWTQRDSAALSTDGDGALDWPAALDFCEALELAGHTDWRLPNAKELHSLLDYSRAPDTSGSAALDPVFEASSIVNETGAEDFAFYWTSTTHLDGQVMGTDAVYIAFGRALGYFMDTFMDVHGAGAQRGDPKVGEDRIGCGLGPQGDCRRVYNLARCVRGG